jgi:hypothetical protein
LHRFRDCDAGPLTRQQTLARNSDNPKTKLSHRLRKAVDLRQGCVQRLSALSIGGSGGVLTASARGWGARIMKDAHAPPELGDEAKRPPRKPWSTPQVMVSRTISSAGTSPTQSVGPIEAKKKDTQSTSQFS